MISKSKIEIETGDTDKKLEVFHKAYADQFPVTILYETKDNYTGMTKAHEIKLDYRMARSLGAALKFAVDEG